MPLQIDSSLNPWHASDKQADWARKIIGLLANLINPPSQSVSRNTTASNNASVLKTSGGRLLGLFAFNVPATVLYIKFYDKATAPVPATDIPVLVFGIPVTNQGINIPIPQGVIFKTGIAFVAVRGITRTDNTATAANDGVISILWN